MIDLQELRRLAEAVKNITVSKDFDGYHTALYRFEAAFSEITAIELLDRLEAAEKVCMAVKECLPTIHVMDAWQKVKEGK